MSYQNKSRGWATWDGQFAILINQRPHSKVPLEVQIHLDCYFSGHKPWVCVFYRLISVSKFPMPYFISDFWIWQLSTGNTWNYPPPPPLLTSTITTPPLPQHGSYEQFQNSLFTFVRPWSQEPFRLVWLVSLESVRRYSATNSWYTLATNQAGKYCKVIKPHKFHRRLL